MPIHSFPVQFSRARIEQASKSVVSQSRLIGMNQSPQFPYRRPSRNLWDLRPQFAHGTRAHAVSGNSNNVMVQLTSSEEGLWNRKSSRHQLVHPRHYRYPVCSLPPPPAPSEIHLPVNCSRTHTQLLSGISLFSSQATKSASTCTSTSPSSSRGCFILSIFPVMLPASPESASTQLLQSSKYFRIQAFVFSTSSGSSRIGLQLKWRAVVSQYSLAHHLAQTTKIDP